MGFFDALTGRSKPVQADISHLFALPGSAVSLEAAESLVPTMTSGVCYKSIDAQSFAAAHAEITELLNAPGDENVAAKSAEVKIHETTDSFSYSWMVLDGTDFDSLVTRTHFVNSTLVDHGFGPQLLCSVFGFRSASSPIDSSATVYIVYLFKQGTFYPFAPSGHETRNSEVELRIKNELAGELPIEPQLTRWFPMWDLPL
jgi:hypothetical protein